jgi:Flp pilus assembly protein TadG
VLLLLVLLVLLVLLLLLLLLLHVAGWFSSRAGSAACALSPAADQAGSTVAKQNNNTASRTLGTFSWWHQPASL